MIKHKDKKSHHKTLKTDKDNALEMKTPHLHVFTDAVQEFESKCQALSHFCCQCCQMTGITIKPSKTNGTLCTTCQGSKTRKENKIKNLPIWFDKNGMVQYHLPKELQNLREGEKLLIQQVSALSLYYI